MRPGPTSWAAQILSNRVSGTWSAPSQARAGHGEETGLAGAGVLEMVRQVGVERHAVALAEGEVGPVAVQDEAPGLDERALASAGLVDRRGGGPRRGRPPGR